MTDAENSEPYGPPAHPLGRRYPRAFLIILIIVILIPQIYWWVSNKDGATAKTTTKASQTTPRSSTPRRTVSTPRSARPSMPAKYSPPAIPVIEVRTGTVKTSLVAGKAYRFHVPRPCNFVSNPDVPGEIRVYSSGFQKVTKVLSGEEGGHFDLGSVRYFEVTLEEDAEFTVSIR